MPRLEFNLSTQDVPILKEVHLSRIIRLSILEPVSVLLNTIFSRGVFKGVTLLEEESINHVIPDFLFKLKTSTADYYLPLEIKLGNFDIVLENSRNGNFSQLAPLAAQCCSQTFTTYSPMSILITQKYIVVFQIPFDLERGDYTVLGGQYFDGLSRVNKVISKKIYKYGNFQVKIFDHSNGRNSLALILLKLAYDRFKNYSTIEVTQAMNIIWQQHRKNPRRTRARAPF